MNTFASAALLAGGKSLRMGFDKQLFHVRKDRLFAHLLRKINTLYIPEAEARRFTPDRSLFSNLNTREDYEAWALGAQGN